MTDFGGCGASEVNREESTEVRRQQKRESEGHHHDVTETASDDTGPETSPGFRNTAKQLLEPNLVSVIATAPPRPPLLAVGAGTLGWRGSGWGGRAGVQRYHLQLTSPTKCVPTPSCLQLIVSRRRCLILVAFAQVAQAVQDRQSNNCSHETRCHQAYEDEYAN
eukprot:2762197-Rhodomonas_salina.3